MSKDTRISRLFLVLALLCYGCSDSEDGAPSTVSGKPVVCTTFYPTRYFAERIGGEWVDLLCPLPADVDPAHWSPSPALIRQFQSADLILLNGAGYEIWLDAVSLPYSKLVDTSKNLEESLIHLSEGFTHSHGPGGVHHHAAVNHHVWLDPALATRQASAIRDAFINLMPSHAGSIRMNFNTLTEDLDLLHEAFMNFSEVLKNHSLLAAHPAYDYLAQRYGWDITQIEVGPDLSPDSPEGEALKAVVAAKQPKCILWKSLPPKQVQTQLRSQLKLESVLFTTCEQPPEPPLNFLTAMKANLERLHRAVSVNTSRHSLKGPIEEEDEERR